MLLALHRGGVDPIRMRVMGRASSDAPVSRVLVDAEPCGPAQVGRVNGYRSDGVGGDPFTGLLGEYAGQVVED